MFRGYPWAGERLLSGLCLGASAGYIRGRLAGPGGGLGRGERLAARRLPGPWPPPVPAADPARPPPARTRGVGGSRAARAPPRAAAGLAAVGRAAEPRWAQETDDGPGPRTSREARPAWAATLSLADAGRREGVWLRAGAVGRAAPRARALPGPAWAAHPRPAWAAAGFSPARGGPSQPPRPTARTAREP